MVQYMDFYCPGVSVKGWFRADAQNTHQLLAVAELPSIPGRGLPHCNCVDSIFRNEPLLIYCQVGGGKPQFSTPTITLDNRSG